MSQDVNKTDAYSAETLLARLLAKGATRVEPDLLQPAETLLDLYGEDIRARAFVTQDPFEGEMMLRPDFTVPVVQKHMTSGASPARYAYAGRVFRRQEHNSRPREYTQVGYEVFEEEHPVFADAEVFTLFAELLKDLPLEPITGDIGLLIAAVDGLNTSPKRRLALRRHIWRPRRFRTLLARFSGELDMPESRKVIANGTQSSAELIGETPVIGKRTMGEVAERIETVRQEARTPDLSRDELEMINTILSIRETSANALTQLRDIAIDLPTMTAKLDQFEARLTALDSRGINVDNLMFEGAYGRTSMEYYDGFVFGFSSIDDAGLPPIASGGRYDALTAALGGGAPMPAVGGVIRPNLISQFKEAQQ